MSGILPSDVLIKTAIELGIEDLRKNPWILHHMLSDFANNPYLKQKYGENQIASCIEWFQNNQIDIYLRYRKDRDRLPCITVTLGESSEKPDLKTLGDRSTESMLLYPNEIGKPIAYIVKPFVPLNYDVSTQTLYLPPESMAGLSVVPGMILVNPSSGVGFIITDVNPNGVVVDIDQKTIASATVFGIVPKYQYYKARIEHTFFRETYNIECTVHGDPSTLLWLHAITVYSLLRYRESLFEANGIAESIVSSSDIFPNASYIGPSGEEAFSRTITMTSQVENTWVKSPQRFIEDVALKEKTSIGYIGGISILSNLDSPAFIDKTKEVWYTDVVPPPEDET